MTQASLFPAVATGAHLSDDGRHRYLLWRIWRARKPVAGFVMLNPSTADAEVDDPTIRRCTGFARAWGCGSIYVCNLFGLRSPHPTVIERADYQDAVGVENDEAILAVAGSVDTLVLAWGAQGGPNAARRSREVLALLEGRRKRRGLMHLGRTITGQPRHPLYVEAGAALQACR